MKKIILSAIIITAFIITTNAQSFHIGAKAGANLGKIQGQSFKSGFDLGYQLGGFIELDFNNNWGIQPELLFSQTTTTVDSTFKSIYTEAIPNLVEGKVHLNYLSIPVLLRLNAGKLLTFHLGPQFSVLTSSDKTLLQEGKQAFRNGDLAAILGAQINLGSLKVYGRYDIGLSNVNNFDSHKWKNQQIQLGLGYRIL
ncbi:MAG: porin family protein [Parafilimonas sp.]